MEKKTVISLNQLRTIERHMAMAQSHLDAIKEILSGNTPDFPWDFPKDHYTPIVKWLHTPEGKAALPDFFHLTWEQRAAALTEIVGWEVNDHNLMVAYNRQ